VQQLDITCITSHFGSGGAERNLVRLAEWLAAEGHGVTLLTLDPGVTDFYHPSPQVKRVFAARLSARISRLMSGRSVDILFSAPNLMHQEIHEQAKATGERL